MALDLPPALFTRYEDKKQIARMPFVINNNVQCTDAYAQLKRQAIDAEKEVFVGIAGLRSLDLLANIGKDAGQGYEKAVLFDNNLTQMKAMNNIFVLIKESATPEEFIDKLTPHYVKWVTQMPREDFRIKGSPEPSKHERKLMDAAGIAPSTVPKRRTKEDVAYFAVQGASYPPRQDAQTRSYFREQMEKPESWLHPDNFAKIKHMVEHQQVETVMLELDDKKRVGQLAGWLKEKDLKVGDMYLSSSLGFMTPADHYDYWGRVNTEQVRSAANANIRSLAGADTHLLNSHGQGLAPGATSGVAQFVLHVEDRECEGLKRMLGKSLPNKDQSYNFAFNAGHATMALRTPSRDDLASALGNPILREYDRIAPDWRDKMTLFTLDVSAPDYVAQPKAGAFVQNARATASKVLRAPPYSAQDLHAAHGERNASLVFMVPSKELAKNNDYIADLAGSIRKGISKDMEKGLQP